MTEKQNRIVTTALELFANDGYTAVSTSKIAQQAGVSEGLIFRHFKNKQGLLDAIMEQAYERAATLYAPIIFEQDPKEVLRKSIALPYNCTEDEFHFWKLLFKLKWELELSGKEKTKPFVDKLANTFQKLDYQDPLKEAEVFQHILESILSGILREGKDSQNHLHDFLLKKYEV